MKDTKKSKPKTMTATEARANFFDVLTEAHDHDEEIVIVRNGEKIAKIVPYEEEIDEDFDWDTYLAELEELRTALSDEDANKILEAREKSKIKRFPDW